MNFHLGPEIAVISDMLLNMPKRITIYRCEFPSLAAADCDLILRIPSENRTLSVEFPCDLTFARENRCDCDSHLWCAQPMSLKHCEWRRLDSSSRRGDSEAAPEISRPNIAVH